MIPQLFKRKIVLWRRYTKSVVGTVVQGDPSMAATGLFKGLFLFFIWRKVALLEVNAQAAVDGWYLVYESHTGHRAITRKPLYEQFIRVSIGREEVKFAAVDEDGNELELSLIRTEDISDSPRFKLI